MPVPCECRLRKIEDEKKQTAATLAAMRSTELRRLSLMDSTLAAVRFSCADQSGDNTGSVAKCRRYAEKFAQMRRDNRGLLLFGGVGTGKTYTAACIANELLAQGIPVVMTSLVKLIDGGADELCSRMAAIDLLILDDLGAERSTDYALEQIYNIVDSRYRSRKPLIVTTNLTLDEIRHPQDTPHARIYDRLLEICVPISCIGVSFRKETAQEKLERMKRLIG